SYVTIDEVTITVQPEYYEKAALNKILLGR
ncbi:unnamed protein product, partial [marine sediment metagenome]